MKDSYPFINREISWVEFNARVLEEALDPSTPLLDRLKFLCIVASNFDEFFMVRVAALKRQIKAGNYTTCPSGMSPREQFEAVAKRTRVIVDAEYRCLKEEIIPGLAAEGLKLVSADSYTVEQDAFLSARFEREIFPVLTPVRVDIDRPLSVPGNLRLHAAFILSPAPRAEDDRQGFVIVQLPPSIPRIIHLPDSSGAVSLTLLEDVIYRFADRIFPGCGIDEHIFFRVTRDADFGVDEERDDDFVEAMEEVLENRRTSAVVRLNVSTTSPRLRAMLVASLGLSESDVYDMPGPLDLRSLMDLTTIEGFARLQEERWRPVVPADLPEDEPLWPRIAARDILLHHPYESFAPVVRLLTDAAQDPGVLAIKMTLYRTSGDSPIVRALEQAAENGKQVTALVELKARFDEEQNIEWAERLERVGVIVIYGVARLKVHAKALLIVRREGEGVRRYVHLGTGNYNDRTARLYTDYSLLTSREDIAYETNLFFNAITGYSAIPNLKKLIMAPVSLKSRLLVLIDREASRSSRESPGLIMAKMNSLADPEIIRALYRASAVGVEIRLNVRGLCMLVPGVKGVSETIEVVSIVDRYLEHARLFFFDNNGAGDVYCSSADWMPRNLERRIELLFPVEQEDAKRRLTDNLKAYFQDTLKARRMKSDGSYERVLPARGEPPLRSQRFFFEQACAGALPPAEDVNRKEFTVRRRPPKTPRKA